MKIYNSITIDWNGNIIEEDYFEYDGPISECKGGVSVPEPSAEEKQLQKEILEQLQESRSLQEKFLPILMETSGYKYDDDGNITKMGYDEYLGTLDPTMKAQYENLQLIQEQAGKALRGEADASPLLEKSLSAQKRQMEEGLSRRLGSDWGQTSSGILAQQEYNTGADIAREQVRNNAINTYGGLGLAGNQAYNLTPSSQLQTASGISQGGTSLLPFYSSALQPYQNQRNMQLQANMQNAQNKSNQLSSLYGALGTIGGFGLGSYLSK